MTGYVRTWRPVDADRPLLVCLPQAGAGTGGYLPWANQFADCDVAAVLLPGREQRFTEPPPRHLHAAVEAIANEVAPLLEGQPLVVFGDSFGGLLGYELALRLPVSALVVTACRAPQWWSGAGRGITRDDVEALVAARAVEVDLDDDSRELLAEMLLADATLSNSYRATPGATLDCPVHAWGGRQDHTVTAPQLDDWIEVAQAGLHRRDFAAGHDLVRRCAAEVTAAVHAVVAEAADRLVVPL